MNMASGNMIFCSTCGNQIAASAAACPKCGAPNIHLTKSSSKKDWLTTFLLCFFLGAFGIHRFYVGKIGTGIIQLITLGGLGIWTIIDFFVIVVGKFRDAEGALITR